MQKSGCILLALIAMAVLSSCATTADTDAGRIEPAEQTEKGNIGNTGKDNGDAEKDRNSLAAATSSNSKLQPFDKVIDGAERLGGFLPVYRKDDKVWLEIAPKDFGRLFYFKSNLDRGIGEKRIYGGMMAYPAGLYGVVQFRRVGDKVQMLMKNVSYTAREGTAEARAVERSFSDSLLAAAAVVSQAHPERASILVEANALLLKDLPAAADMLGQTYRQSYTFDERNSYIAQTRANDDLIVFDVNAHYSLAHIAMPSPRGQEPPHPSLMPQPTLPTVLPDVRSMFLGFSYSLAPLPETMMKPRVADERVGYFINEKFDFTADQARLPTVRLINRWRLEKQNPSSLLSEPITPITYWLDPSIPERYRAPIIAGVLEWNKAFEKIGFKDAIRVEVTPDAAEFSTSDLRRPSIRWLTTAQPSFGGIGQTVVDPRSGEILDADIGLDASQVRAIASIFGETIDILTNGQGAADFVADDACVVANTAAQEVQFGMSLLALRGDVVRDDLATRQFVNDYLKYITMHEVGHTLGLRHNFHASTVYHEKQLSDPAFTREHGLAGSVMEYLPWNIALAGETQGAYQMTTLGAYDYWAIEYGYREFSEDEEAEALRQIAARGLSDPLLVYATDEDASILALDPEVNTQDLGDDPLAYAEKKIKLVNELWARIQSAELSSDQSYSVLRRNFQRGITRLEQSVTLAARYLGGVYQRAARPGDAVAPLIPVPAAKQRAALRLLERQVFSANSFEFSPEFLRHMAVTSFDQRNARALGTPPQLADIALDQMILAVQKKALQPLMSDRVAQRIINNQAKSDAGDDVLTLGELYEMLRRSIWSEVSAGKEISLMRRNLQREHARVIATTLLTSKTAPAEARALLRFEATQLYKTITALLDDAQKKRKLTRESMAHLEETRFLLKEALNAVMIRSDY
ncbi:MAG: zinc-dependent metalloprotease [Burkholderiales bacterium]|jgi:hypothetical protein|nr:zinc-dependent metalloprotease [Burkholderiales bacterium]